MACGWSSFFVQPSGFGRSDDQTRQLFRVGGDWLPWIWHFPRNIGCLSSSQLTNSIIFQRAFFPTTNQILIPLSMELSSLETHLWHDGCSIATIISCFHPQQLPHVPMIGFRLWPCPQKRPNSVPALHLGKHAPHDDLSILGAWDYHFLSFFLEPKTFESLRDSWITSISGRKRLELSMIYRSLCVSR